MAGQVYSYGGIVFLVETGGNPWIPQPSAEGQYVEQHAPGGDVNYVDWGGKGAKKVTWDVSIDRADQGAFENLSNGHTSVLLIGQDTGSDTATATMALSNCRVLSDRSRVAYSALFILGDP